MPSFFDRLSPFLDSAGELAGKVGDVADKVNDVRDRIDGSRGSDSEPEKDVQRDVVLDAKGPSQSISESFPWRTPLIIGGALIVSVVLYRAIK